MPRFLNPARDLARTLLCVEKPARYAGGEYGRLAARDAALYAVAAFPDLYEIGMSNQALKILYNRLNALAGVSCDRAFAPAPDFEQALLRASVPLYGLDTGIALKDADLLLFSFGYELGITGILTMLSSAGIALHAGARGEGEPVVIAGGVCASNPLPYASFIDAFWIGEAEAGFFSLIEGLVRLKEGGAPRAALLEAVRAHPSIWHAGKTGQARRAVHASFARESALAVYPVPSMRVVQQHGFVEIMRGCPNGCRFCHAGAWYRPMRQKDADRVFAEVEAFVEQGGFREICLSSLSSADYDGIDRLVFALNARYRARRVSFQLPSLHVSTCSLPLLEELSRVRKSGLTFAIETPDPASQRAINKTLELEQVAAILIEAKRRGWKSAKLYFMFGLCPEDEGRDEAGEAARFVRELARKTRMTFSVNAGVFIPKPHTPYQWSRQDGRAAESARAFARALRPQGHKVRAADGLTASVEGVLSRGDERAGALVEEAFRSGARLDAWEDHFNAALWQRILDGHSALAAEFLGARDDAGPLPWDCVEGGLSPRALSRERERMRAGILSAPCAADCAEPCGACRGAARLSRAVVPAAVPPESVLPDAPESPAQNGLTYRAVFAYRKAESAVFLSHLSVIEVFFAAFVRAGIPVLYSEGFNPLPRLSFASPSPVGLCAEAEIAAVDLSAGIDGAVFRQRLSAALPEGLSVNHAEVFTIPRGAKKVSPPGALWGFVYRKEGAPEDEWVPAAAEKAFRGEGAGLLGLVRRAVLARPEEPSLRGIDYFERYRRLYRPFAV